MNSRVRSRGGNGLPSTVTTSFAVTSSAGELMTRPLTVTRPCVTISSASRREASPARDTTLAMRSPDFFGLRLGRAARACRIQACARDRRRGRRTPDVLRKPCCRPRCRGAADRQSVGSRLAARMLLPVGDRAFGPVDRRGRSNFGRSLGDDPRANAKTADARRRRDRRAACRSAACRNCARRRGTDGNCVRTASRSRFCHGFGFAAISADDRQNPCAGRGRAAIRAPRENFLSPPNLRAIAGTIAVARRSRAIRPVATRTVAVLAETFAARRVGALLAAAVPRRIGPLVAELLLGEASGRARIVAIPARAARSSRL